MCNAYESSSCCAQIHATEINDGYEHLINVGGTLIDEEKCARYVKDSYPALQQYFCLFCDPLHLSYMSCCDSLDPNGMDCAGNTTLYKEGGACNSKKVNTLRVCQSFVDKIWANDGTTAKAGKKDGSNFDACGMNIWSGATETTQNPNGIVGWGDVDGSTGDDPILPSIFWEGQAKNFFRDTKPPLFDQVSVTLSIFVHFSMSLLFYSLFPLFT